MEHPIAIGPGLLGFLAVMLLHIGMSAGASLAGFELWFVGFGVFQLGFLVPLVVVMIWRGAPREAVVGVFVAAALGFAANAAWIALSGLSAGLV